MRLSTAAPALAILILSSCASSAPATWSFAELDPTEFQTVGIIAETIEPYGVTKTNVHLETLVAGELIRKGYRVADRTNLHTVHQELKRQQLDLYDDATRQEVGEALGVQAMLFLTHCRRKDEKDRTMGWSTTAELILVSQGQIVGTCTYQTKACWNFQTTLPPFEEHVRLLMAAFPSIET